MNRWYEKQHISCGRYSVYKTDMDDAGNTKERGDGIEVEVIFTGDNKAATFLCRQLKKAYNEGRKHERQRIGRQLIKK